MVNPGAHYRCPEACGVFFAVRESNDAYNTVGINVGAYNTICVRWLWNTVPAGVQSMVPVPWFDSRAAFSVRPWSLPSGHPRSDGPSRLRLRRSEKSGEQGSYVPRSERRGVGVGSRARGRPFDRRGRPEATGARIERSDRIGAPK